ncbi:MFS transporter [Burkholderia multivorans]|uniref:MFS transporter n=1 Tax=Burkholderia multivorans TaxID=87883 RepID=UPI0009E0DECC|nr:MFS transporter [Burkholderia multivorans]SAK18014.1 major facilitator transporter [Burkholderia multivorans]
MQLQIERSQPVPGARQAGPFHALILLGTVIVATLAPTVVGPVLPDMQRHFASVPGIETLVPVVVTMPMLVLGVLAMFIGALTDRIGRKRVLVVSLVLYAIAGVAPMFLDSIHVIIASRAVVGLAEAAVMTCGTSLIGDYFSGERRDRYASLQTTFASISAFLFNLLGGALGEHGWRTPFIAYALPLLLAPLVQFYLWETEPAAARPAVARAAADERAFNPWSLAAICAIGFAAGLVFMIVPVHLSFMLVDAGTHSPQQIGFSYAMNNGGIIVGTVLFGWVLARHASIARQLAVGAAIGGAGFVIMGNASDFTWLTIGGAVNGIGCGVLLPTVISGGLRILPLARRGFGTGAFTGALFFGYFCSPLLVMPMIAHWGSRGGVVHGWGLALVGTAIVSLTLSLGVRRPRAA